MNHSNVAKISSGYSVVEFMIAMTLGLLIIATIGTVYLTNRTNYRIQEGLARLQENARFANYFLAREIRMAGYQGCANEDHIDVANIIQNPSYPMIYTDAIKGFDGLSNTFSPSLPTNLTSKALPNTDVVEIRRASNNSAQLSANMNLTNNPVLVYDRLGIQAGDVVMITNCTYGDIFIAGSNTNATAITHTESNNTTNHLSFSYTQQGSQVMRFIYYAFYIKDTGRTNSANEPIYALVRQDINGNEEEIVEGIEQMRVLYGVDTNGDNTADHYQTATEVESSNDWGNVISLKINLLFATTENVARKIQPYQFNGTSYTPTDRKLRREWQSFVTLRNRGLPS